MRRTATWIFVLLSLQGAAMARPFDPNANPNPFCAAVPRADWLSYPEVQTRLKEVGYELVRLRLADDRCYAVAVRDVAGRMLTLILHPVTAEIVRTRH